MQNFTFNGNWEYELDLQDFKKSNANWNRNLGANYIDRPIKLKIHDLKNFDPDPLPEQLFTINYLLNNELRVLDDLCTAFSTINQHYGEMTGFHDWYSNDIKGHELGNIFLISEIEILKEHKNGSAYVQFSGGYKGDEEHGLIVAMHEDRLIGYNQIGEDCDDGIYTDLGDERQSFIDFNIKHQDFGKETIYEPLPKYGKYKPWQGMVMTEYFVKLLRAKDNEKIKVLVTEKNFDINYRIDYDERSLTDLAAFYGNVEILDFLINKGGDFSNAILNCNHQESIAYLVKKGISIDYLTGYGATRLHQSIRNYASALKRNDQRAIELHKDWIKFYLALGADPDIPNKWGQDYKAVIRSFYKDEVLAMIETKIQELIDLEKG